MASRVRGVEQGGPPRGLAGVVRHAPAAPADGPSGPSPRLVQAAALAAACSATAPFTPRQRDATERD